MTDEAGYRPTDDSALRWEDCHCTKCGQPDKKCECVALTPGTKPTVSSNSCNVPETLRGIVREGGAWISAGIIGEAANLLDDIDALLGRLAECFGDDETEFVDIKLMRDRIAAVDTRSRHDATDESAHRHSPETDELLSIARDLSTMDCFWSASGHHEADCKCLSGRAERAIAAHTQKASE